MQERERQLIMQAQQGDTRAFEKLMAKYDRRVMSIAFAMAGHYGDAEDITQEVFIKVYRSLPAFRFESDFYTWLYRIVVNTALTHRRKAQRGKLKSIDTMNEQDTGSRWDLREKAAGPDMVLLKVHGGNQPGLLKELHQQGRKDGFGGIARPEFFDGLTDGLCNPARIDIKMAQDQGEIRPGVLEQLCQQVFYGDLIMGTGDAEARRCLKVPPSTVETLTWFTQDPAEVERVRSAIADAIEALLALGLEQG